MIKKLTHVSLLVENQEEALKFFVEKLGFEKKDDTLIGGTYRSLTIVCKGDPTVEIALILPEWSMNEAVIKERRAQIGKQHGLCFASDDIEGDSDILSPLKERGSQSTTASPHLLKQEGLGVV